MPHRFHQPFVLICVCLTLVFSAGQTQAQEKPKTFPEGARCLFIGHSFFVPVAKAFDRVAKENKFGKHHADLVFAGGQRGGPGALWNNERLRPRIEAKLKTGKVDLMGMTIAMATQYQDYANWIDLALEHNPDTVFFIGVCWVPGGPQMPAAQFGKAIELAGDKTFMIVKKLRAEYPKNTIHLLNYGKTASGMKAMFESNELDDITDLVGRRSKQALFTDQPMGHAGPMLLELSALTWLDQLYAADPTKLKHSGYDADDVKQITDKVRQFNKGLNAAEAD